MAGSGKLFQKILISTKKKNIFILLGGFESEKT